MLNGNVISDLIAQAQAKPFKTKNEVTVSSGTVVIAVVAAAAFVAGMWLRSRRPRRRRRTKR